MCWPGATVTCTGGIYIYIYLIIMELGRFFVRTNLGNRAEASQQTRSKRRSAIRRVSSAGFPCEMKVLRQLAIRYYRTPFLFYGGKRSRLRNSQLIPLLHNSSWEDGATASLL